MEEVEEAEREGVKFQFLLSPVDLVQEKGKLAAVKMRRMGLGDFDRTGRRKPVADAVTLPDAEPVACRDTTPVADAETVPDAEPVALKDGDVKMSTSWTLFLVGTGKERPNRAISGRTLSSWSVAGARQGRWGQR